METVPSTMTLEEALDIALGAIDARISDLLTTVVNTDDRDTRVRYNNAVIAYALAATRIREDIKHNKASQS